MEQENIAETREYLQNYREKVCRKLCRNYRANKQRMVRDGKGGHVPGELTGKPGCVEWYHLPGGPFGKRSLPFAEQLRFAADCPDFVNREEVA